MGKFAFALTMLGALTVFAREAWPYVKTWLDERRVRERKEQLRLDRERAQRGRE